MAQQNPDLWKKLAQMQADFVQAVTTQPIWIALTQGDVTLTEFKEALCQMSAWTVKKEEKLGLTGLALQAMEN
jgi:hypothetical protein